MSKDYRKYLDKPAKSSSGLLKADFLQHVQFGAVFEAKDPAIILPETRVATSGTRTEHPFRRVILVQSEVLNKMQSVRTILVVPCTSSFDANAIPPGDLLLPETEPAFTKERVYALCRLTQPILKDDLVKYVGILSPETTARLQVELRRLLTLGE